MITEIDFISWIDKKKRRMMTNDERRMINDATKCWKKIYKNKRHSVIHHTSPDATYTHTHARTHARSLAVYTV